MNPPLRRGEFVIVTAHHGPTVRAMVGLASKPNGRSILLLFDGRIGGWIGSLAACQRDSGEWESLDGLALTITRTEDFEP